MSDRVPVIGVLANSELLDGVEHQAVREVYLRAVADVADCVGVVLPADPGVVATLDRLDGVVLTGHETNVDPARYGGAPAGEAAVRRDAAALAVVLHSVRMGIPLLGVCRGLQEINVAYGGTLRDLDPAAGHREDLTLPRDEQYLPAHQVTLTPGGVLHRIMGHPRLSVNSLHRQAVDRLAPGLRVEAVACDGVVEAASVARATELALGVQWHAEWHAATDPVCRSLFLAFGAACRLRASRGYCTS
jgi:putative glutamine amidotransferase